ncbi:rCG49557 [Rattus norvegicus]|uniref:RCG49557 n=1 Tax=Rattus norvegicus TaxID=10116 RepID=A6J3B5_RAT|nr:rCG49557 [Rattus norvegicus]
METAATATTRYSVRPEVSEVVGDSRLSKSARTSGILSAIATVSVTVAERGGWPWSCTDTTRFCLRASLSIRARAVLTSPVCSPTEKSPGSLAFSRRKTTRNEARDLTIFSRILILNV